jgi:putative NADH-flavin reductase
VPSVSSLERRLKRQVEFLRDEIAEARRAGLSWATISALVGVPADVVRTIHDEDHGVVAFTRHPEGFPIEHPRLEVAAGDVHDVAAVASAITGTDAVFSTLGVPFGKTPITVYSDGIANIIAAMHAAGIKRLVVVSSSAVSPHPEPLGGFVFEKIMQPYVVNKLGKTLYDDMRRMEAIVSASDLAWTIVRPSGLFEAPAVSDYAVAIDHIGHRFTARIDLADLSVAPSARRRVGVFDDRGGRSVVNDPTSWLRARRSMPPSAGLAASTAPPGSRSAFASSVRSTLRREPSGSRTHTIQRRAFRSTDGFRPPITSHHPPVRRSQPAGLATFLTTFRWPAGQRPPPKPLVTWAFVAVSAGEQRSDVLRSLQVPRRPKPQQPGPTSGFGLYGMS